MLRTVTKIVVRYNAYIFQLCIKQKDTWHHALALQDFLKPLTVSLYIQAYVFTVVCKSNRWPFLSYVHKHRQMSYMVKEH